MEIVDQYSGHIKLFKFLREHNHWKLYYQVIF